MKKLRVGGGRARFIRRLARLAAVVTCIAGLGQAFAAKPALTKSTAGEPVGLQSAVKARDQLVWLAWFRSTLLRAQGRIEFAHRWSWNTGDLVKHDCIDDGLTSWLKLVSKAEHHEALLRQAIAKNNDKSRHRHGSALANDHLRAIMIDMSLRKCGLSPLFDAIGLGK